MADAGVGHHVVSARIGVYVNTPTWTGQTLALFQAFNSKIAPRKIDSLHFLQDLNQDPAVGAGWVSWAQALGADTMFITLSPFETTMSAFTAGTYDTTGLNGGTGLAGLAAQLAAASAAGLKVIVRLAHEFNGNWAPAYGNTHETAAQFVAGWRHIVQTMRAHGATAVRWCWCPNAYGHPFDNTVDPLAADSSGVNWYPGGDVVDLFGLDGYIDVEDTYLLTPSDLFNTYITIRAAINKPGSISEFGCAADSRLAAFCGGKSGWYDQFFAWCATLDGLELVQQWEQPGNTSTPGDDWTIDSSGLDMAASRSFAVGAQAPPFTLGAKTPAHT